MCTYKKPVEISAGFIFVIQLSYEFILFRRS